jgi:hypothetical protein
LNNGQRPIGWIGAGSIPGRADLEHDGMILLVLSRGAGWTRSCSEAADSRLNIMDPAKTTVKAVTRAAP